MQPGTYAISVRAGDTRRLPLTLSNPTSSGTAGTPIDLTGASAQFILRTAQAPTGIQLTVLSTQPTANGSSLTLGGTAGTITLVLTSADTDTLKLGSYDIRVKFPDGTTQTYLTGAFSVSSEAEPWGVAQ